MGLHAFVGVALATEDMLQRFGDGRMAFTPYLGDLIACAIDALGELAEDRVQQELIEELLGRLATSLDENFASPPSASEADSSRSDDHADVLDLDDELRQQQNIPAELREIFREEAEDHIKSIYAGLEQLENDTVDRGLVQEVRRAAHTLKGAAGAVGLSVVTQLSHRMEDLLDQLYDGNAQVSPNLLSLLWLPRIPCRIFASETSIKRSSNKISLHTTPSMMRTLERKTKMLRSLRRVVGRT